MSTIHTVALVGVGLVGLYLVWGLGITLYMKNELWADPWWFYLLCVIALPAFSVGCSFLEWKKRRTRWASIINVSDVAGGVVMVAVLVLYTIVFGALQQP